MADINGKMHAQAILDEVRAAGKKCKLAVVLVGDNPASIVYINMKKKACEQVGFDFELFKLPEDSPQSEVLALIDKINDDDGITGAIIQQPFPAHLNKGEILERLSPKKDVDCLHPQNVGLAVSGTGRILPCTPAGCIKLLKREGISIAGKRAVVVGRSDIVGKPLALMLLAEHATVTICHSRTENLAEECRNADILVAAIGSPKFITADMVKRGAVVLDVGVSRLAGKKVCGDVDYESVSKIASYITPVPGGVGPMTVAVLIENCLKAWELTHG
ncbi:MAG: bifunctional 5,10-methylenetetrahydrofolate dehydrogenase/5,10-methenyltetrahydrofolate cyclohydrolase [Defluviitaleaceae bacterium]|nr:bifunctional 5,10-methylenetetrahydrofolate dehydrogenase/5,10-methenyltetrahydrofolate cyclohydrolase [Defluviitaleaceae bacterium]